MAQPHSRTHDIADRMIPIRTEGKHQIVHLPDDVRFDGNTVFMSRDAGTGDVTLSQRPRVRTWARLVEILDEMGPVPDDFLADRPLNKPLSSRDIFDDDSE